MSKRRKQAERREQPKGADLLPPLWLPWAIAAALVLLVAVVYGQTASFPFISLDDEEFVYGNPHVLGGLTWENVAWAWTSAHSANWIPSVWMSLMLDAELYCNQAGGYHATNAVLHAATSVILFLALWRLTGALWPSAFVAGLFAVHPLHVESVAWVSERKDALSGLFFALTLLAYERYARRPFGAGRYALVVVLFALGLTAKSMLVTTPFVLLLIDYWPLRRLADERRRALLEKLPMLALVAAASAVTLRTQAPAMSTAEYLPYTHRLANAVGAYGAYVRDTLFPEGLSIFYPYPKGGIATGQVLLGGAVLAAGFAAAWVSRRRRPYVLVGWLWFVGMLVPVIGVVQVGMQARADRYMYLPSIGLGIIAAWGGAELVSRYPRRGWAVAGAGAASLIVLTALAHRQTEHWRDTESLFRHAAACTPRNAFTERIVGGDLNRQGRYDEAVPHLQGAVAEQPDDIVSLNRLAEALLRLGRAEEALAALTQLEAIQPDSALVQNSKGNALLLLKRDDEARTAFLRAVELDPNLAAAQFNLGSVLQGEGRHEEAEAHYRRALELQPDWPEVRNNLGGLLRDRKQPRAAEEQFQAALRSDPAYFPTLINYGRLCYAEGRTAEAVGLFNRALQAAAGPRECDQVIGFFVEGGQLDAAIDACHAAVLRFPNDPATRNNLASLLVRRGRTEEAIPHYRRAIELQPANDAAHFNLGAIYHLQGRLDLAADHYRKALAANPQNADAKNNLTALEQQRRK